MLLGEVSVVLAEAEAAAEDAAPLMRDDGDGVALALALDDDHDDEMELVGVVGEVTIGDSAGGAMGATAMAERAAWW